MRDQCRCSSTAQLPAGPAMRGVSAFATHQCTWYRSMYSVCSRLRLPSHASLTCFRLRSGWSLLVPAGSDLCGAAR